MPIIPRCYQNEKPSDVDSFNSQGHDYVAKAIRNVLISENSPNIIGIEGGLGAGKSTVIEILTSILNKDSTPNNYTFHVVTFDLDQHHSALKSSLVRKINDEIQELITGHANQPRKNSIMEKQPSRIKRLLSKKPKNLLFFKKKKKLKELKEAVDLALGKKLEYTKSTNSRVSFYVLLFAISLFLMTSNIAPAIKFLFPPLSDTITEVNRYAGIIQCLLTISPLIILFISFIHSFKNPKYCIGNMLNRNGEDTISETLDINKEVGPIELQNAFGTFIKLIPESKTLILVIDNLDRLSPNDIKKIWSELEIFTSLAGEKFKILLPYSEQHLMNSLSESKYLEDLRTAKEYLSKRLPVVFSAPPIVTAGWRKQFENYWTITLSDISGINGVTELIDVWNEANVTPRFLKNLVNRIGTRIDGCPENENISGVSCAAYILALGSVNEKDPITIQSLLTPISSKGRDESDKDHNENVDEEIKNIYERIRLTHSILNKYVGSSEEWSKQIACLYYQTTFDFAQSELLAEPIRSAISSLNAERLLKLKEIFGFDIFFRKEIDNSYPPQLIKLAAKIRKTSEESHNWVNDWINDVNQLSSESYIKTLVQFDQEYLTSVKELKNVGINIDLGLINRSEITLAKEIKNDSEMLSEASLDDFSRKQSNLTEKVLNLNSYWSLTQKNYELFTKPPEHFFVNILWGIREKLSGWNIDRLLMGTDKTNLIYEASAKFNHKNDSSVSLFENLLSILCLGEIDKVFLKKATLDLRIVPMDVLLFMIPFSAKWHEKTIIQELIAQLKGLESKNDSELIDRMVAIILSACISHLTSLTEVIIAGVNIRGQTVQSPASTFLIPLLEKYPKYSNYLTDYLVASSSDFYKIIIFAFENNAININKNIIEMIEQERISKFEAASILGDPYIRLKKITLGLPVKDLLIWFEKWQINFNDITKWSKEALNDIVESGGEFYTKKLQGYIDSSKNDKEFWLENIRNKPPVFIYSIQHLKKNSLQLKNPESLHGLQETLKSILNEDDLNDAALTNDLCSILPSKSLKSVVNIFESEFKKQMTGNETRKQIINHFGKHFKLPIATEELQPEYVAFVESIQPEESTILAWLAKQDTGVKWEILKKISGSSGWHLKEWSKENLQLLDIALSKFPQGMLDELKKAVSDMLPKPAE